MSGKFGMRENFGLPPVPSNNTSNVLSSLEGTNYADLIRANPYRNVEYKKSPWQQFLTSLGIRTQADSWKENMEVQANEYDAAIMQKAYNERYESPIAEAGRLSEAGMNPDLQGIGDVAGASDMPEDPSTPMQSTADDARQIVGALNFITSAVGSGFAIAKNFADLKRMRILNAQGDITTGQQVAEYARWLLDNNRYNPDATNVGNPREQQANHVESLFKTHRRSVPRKYRDQFHQSLLDYMDSLNYESSKWKTTEDINSSMLNVARQQTSEFYGDGTFDSMKVVNKGVVKLSDSLVKLSLMNREDYERQFNGEQKAFAENAENLYKADYYGSLNGKTKASAENATNDFTAQQRRIDKVINSTLSDIVHGLARQADRGDIFAQSMLFSFAIARMSSITVGPKGATLGFNPR